MKIIVCEHLTEEGHVNLFANICKLLANKGYEVIAVIPSNFPKDLPSCENVRMNMRYYSDEYPHSSSLNKLRYGLRVQKCIRNIYKTHTICATIVVTYDEIALAIGRFAGFLKGPYFIIQNLNPDAIKSSKYRRWAYDFFKNRVYSVVLAGFIKDYLVSSLHTNPDNVLVLPHPMYSITKDTPADIDCVGLSNSNDESIIEEIINSEKNEGLIKKNNLKVLLKSKKFKYDNGNLKIVNGFLDSGLYDDYIARAKCILLPFPYSFKYRVSGTLIDAMSNNKCVIGSNILVVTHSSKYYGNVIKVYNEASFVKDVVNAGINNQLKMDDFGRFQEQHSEYILSKILSNAVENAIAHKPMVDSYDF